MSARTPLTTDYRLGLGISEEHVALSDSVRRFAVRHLSDEVVRAAVEKPGSLPGFWSALADQGLLGLHVEEAHGGQGGGLLELAVALEAIGRTCAPGPYLATVLTSGVLAAAGESNAAGALLPGLVDGSVRGAVALSGAVTGHRDSTGAVTATGRLQPVLGGDLADLLVLAVEIDGTRRWFALDTADLTVTPGNSIDVVRGSAVVTAAQVRVPAERELTGLDTAAIEAVAAVVLGAEAVGVASWCVQTAAEYAVVREQFGRPIAQFQGVKHRCARMGINLEQARAAVWDAARAVDTGHRDAGYAAAIARLVAPDAAVSAARDCMQVLGGIGYTWEHDAHLYYRRALVLRGLLGRPRDCAEDIGRRTVAGDNREVSVELPAEDERLREQVRTELGDIASLGPSDQLVRLGDDGWVMPFLPPPFGRGAGPMEQVVIAQEMKAAGIIAPELGLATWLMPSIVLNGTDDQRERLVKPTLRSEILWCQMFSEPEAGSDLAALRTEAVKVDGGWQVNGQKIWTSLGFAAEWGVLLARTDPTAAKHAGITYFLVQMDTPGINVRPLREASGGTLFSEIFFTDVFIPDSGVVGEVNAGWQVARGTLSNERVSLGKGLALNANVGDLIAFARAHEDVPLDRLGELVAQNQTLQLLNSRAVLRQLRGLDNSTTANVAKYLNMHFGQQVADFCHAELGSAGVLEEADPASSTWIEKTVSSRAMTVYGGTSEVQLNVIGERMLGLPRDPGPGR
jgi:3-oxochol-4-en-24-oyl-CoA dehydrogenase